MLIIPFKRIRMFVNIIIFKQNLIVLFKTKIYFVARIIKYIQDAQAKIFHDDFKILISNNYFK